jgi:hypothetical protein
MKEFKGINFSPFQNNVIDFLGREDLITRSGIPVTLRQFGMEFKINIGADYLSTYSNTEASYFLNTREVGIIA